PNPAASGSLLLTKNGRYHRNPGVAASVVLLTVGVRAGFADGELGIAASGLEPAFEGVPVTVGLKWISVQDREPDVKGTRSALHGLRFLFWRVPTLSRQAYSGFIGRDDE